MTRRKADPTPPDLVATAMLNQPSMNGMKWYTTDDIRSSWVGSVGAARSRSQARTARADIASRRWTASRADGVGAPDRVQRKARKLPRMPARPPDAPTSGLAEYE